MTEAEDGWMFSGRLLRVRPDPDKVDSAYLSYFFGWEPFREYVRRFAVGATMPSLNTTIMSQLPVLVPPLPEQRAIAHILGTLDDKIENNRRMSATLEAMARALYQAWFVDFEPVRARMAGRPSASAPGDLADLFPDRLVPSELGEIPEGWRVGTTGEVLSSVRVGVGARDIDPGTPYISLADMPQDSIALHQWQHADGVESGKSAFERGDILFGKLRPYFHKVGIAPVSGVCSTDILVLRPVCERQYSLAVCLASSDAFVDYATATSAGTRMPRASWNVLERYPLTLPDDAVVEEFDTLCTSTWQRIVALTQESRLLRESRDALLPRLVSGELRVPEMEEAM